MSVLAVALTMSVQALTYAEVLRMSPAAAGDAILGDRPHGVIAAFEGPGPGMLPPNTTEGQLVERPTIDGSACVRRRWTVTFRARDRAPIASAIVDHVYGGTEIALPAQGTCPTGQYAGLSGYDVRDGWNALRTLNAIIAGKVRTHIRCHDETSSGLCKDDRAVLRSLGTLLPWHIRSEGGDTVIWLTNFTEIRFAAADPTRVTVTRRIPAPF